jgi:hypothetical protein
VQLVAAGVRIRYAQLLTAANSMVPGVEVWVQAQQLLGVRTDIPDVAVAVCCASEMSSCIPGLHKYEVREVGCQPQSAELQVHA